MEEILSYLDYIDSEMSGGSFAKVNKKAVLSYTAKIRELISDFSGEKQLRDQQEKAQRIVEMAEQRRAQLVDENGIVDDAKRKATEILQKTAMKQKEYAEATKDSLREILTANAKLLEDSLDSLNRALNNLKK